MTATSITPTLRQSARRSVFWIVTAAGLIALVVISLLLARSVDDLPRLSPESAAPDGARAVVQVLRDQGVEVTSTATLDDTEEAIDDPGTTTLVVSDPNAYLDDEARARVVTLADGLVLLEPGFETLEDLVPGIRSAGSPDDDPLEPACDLPAAIAAESVSPGGTGYRVDGDVTADACLRGTATGADDTFSLVRVTGGTGTTVTVVGATDALTNATVLDEGNAAFALTLLGERANVVWYLPSVADVVEAGDPGLLTPGWVTPTLLLLTLTVVAAAVWRGRRFGPLIVEDLPVVVRATETMEGRARLYQQASARLRALDAVRIGTVSRLAQRLGLGSASTVGDVAAEVGRMLGTDPRVIRSLLVDDLPATDADLVRLSDALLELDRAVAAALRA